MADLVFMQACVLVLLTVLALVVGQRRLPQAPWLLMSVGWHGPGDGS